MITHIVAETTGTVSMVYVESGCQVSEGEALLEIEVMKMMVRVDSPATGKLTLHVGPSEFTEEGSIIGEIDDGA